MINLIRKVTKPLAVSGRESEMAGVICEEMIPCVDECRVDAMGNVVAVKYGNGENRKKLMYSAHMDEIGFIVTYIDDNGYIRFQGIGAINYFSAAFTVVVFENGVKGVMVPDIDAGPNDARQERFFVDIGAKDKKDAERRVSVGMTFAVESGVTRLAGSRVAGRPMDDRIGVAVLIAAAQRMAKAGETPYNDIYYVFSVQEEVGCRGAQTAAYSIMPDYGISLDGTGTGDCPGSKPMAVQMGKGVAVKLKDVGVVCDRYLVDKMTQECKTRKIRCQREIFSAGRTDSSVIQTAGAGVATGGISVPMRYIHSSVEVVDMADMEEAVRLVVAMTQCVLD